MEETWRRRLLSSDPADLNRFSSGSRAHHIPYFRWDSRVEDRLIAMRESPPENLKRVPCPKALLYYLPRDPELQDLDVALPRSTRTIWNMLHQPGLIAERKEVKRQPLVPREPLEVQTDFKDASTVPSSESPQGKKQHSVEVCNFVDTGTSSLCKSRNYDNEICIITLVSRRAARNSLRSRICRWRAKRYVSSLSYCLLCNQRTCTDSTIIIP